MFDFDSWLNEEIETRGFLGDTVNMPRWRYLAFLFFCNGARFQVGGWGCISTGPNNHRLGLEQEEAINLIYFGAYLNGLHDGGLTDVYDRLFLKFDEYAKEFGLPGREVNANAQG